MHIDFQQKIAMLIIRIYTVLIKKLNKVGFPLHLCFGFGET